MKYRFDVTPQQAQLIMDALNQLPRIQSNDTWNALYAQITQQNDAAKGISNVVPMSAIEESANSDA